MSTWGLGSHSSPTDINAFLGSSTIAGLAFRILITNIFHEDFSQRRGVRELDGQGKGMTTRRQFCVLLTATALSLDKGKSALFQNDSKADKDLAELFAAPPKTARPYVLWMWMGCNISKSGITLDLEALQEAGFGGVTIFSLADTLIPWAGTIAKSPTPEIIAFTEPWWQLVRHAAIECKRLGLEMILHNCAGYESSGGTWITAELSMQEVVWSEQKVEGGSNYRGTLAKPTVDPHPHAQFPQVYLPELGKVGIPVVEARKTFFRDIAVLALPSEGAAAKDQVIDLTRRMDADGNIEWSPPAGSWNIYRFGHTTTGAMIQPAQLAAMGLECDKMNREAVTFHVKHVLGEIDKHLGDLLSNSPSSEGAGLTTLYFDSYEAGNPTWTPRMGEEFQRRRGYDLTPWLPVIAGRTVASEQETERFKVDFKRTIQDLYRDEYWATPGPLAHAAGLKFVAEPYEGPWVISEVVPFLDIPAVEFWTTNNVYSPSSLDPVVQAAHAIGDQLIVAESFTTQPQFAAWREHPAWLKPIGDAAFCAGVNRFNLHHCVQQPWDSKYKPGNAMGQWGVHFGRLQTWWNPGKAWVTYVWRCQALLQSGRFVAPSAATSLITQVTGGTPVLKSIHRSTGKADIYFVANTAWTGGTAVLSFPLTSRLPELWDPVSGSMRELSSFTQDATTVSFELEFAPTQSFFLVFRKPLRKTTTQNPNVQPLRRVMELGGDWQVSFDPNWGGPAQAVHFATLMDWTMSDEPGIRYYSGTAIYRKRIKLGAELAGRRLHLHLGVVRHVAEVTVNGKHLGVVWTAPWSIEVSGALMPAENEIEIAVTNVWANRLIGDEQQPADVLWEIGDPVIHSGQFLKEFPEWFLHNEPRPSAGRYTFTTWNYFTKDTALETSGLLGPVSLMQEA
jgi:hypothetical protein